jgi:hypothetical protein
MARLLTRDPFEDPEGEQSPASASSDADLTAVRKAVRVNFDLEANAHRRLKAAAALEGRTIADVTRELLLGWLDSRTP